MRKKRRAKVGEDLPKLYRASTTLAGEYKSARLMYKSGAMLAEKSKSRKQVQEAERRTFSIFHLSFLIFVIESERLIVRQ